jgi:A/G-specific adenine glycosylase
LVVHRAGGAVDSDDFAVSLETALEWDFVAESRFEGPLEVAGSVAVEDECRWCVAGGDCVGVPGLAPCAPCIESELPLSTTLNVTTSRTISATNRARRTNRRRQYTEGGRDPTGRNILPDTVARDAGCPAATRRRCRARMRAMSRTAQSLELCDAVSDWYQHAARDLPWRVPGVGAWPVLVSEVMLQQTPVSRVLPAWHAWLERWPEPADLAAASAGDAVRMWGKLGYPRRALRLHECARTLVARYRGIVPSDVAELESLPGIGAYTARAVAVFAYRARHPVVDVNVRRVVARLVEGQGQPAPPSAARDHAAVAQLLPDDRADAARASVALMELGALVCTARAPRCDCCPVAASCAWLSAGSPPYTGPTVPPQRFAGTDRQVRGLLLDILRSAHAPVTRADLDLAWPHASQRERALDTLVADGLVDPLPDGRFALPS